MVDRHLSLQLLPVDTMQFDLLEHNLEIQVQLTNNSQLRKG